MIFFFFNDTATTEICTLALHDALPICGWRSCTAAGSSPWETPSCTSRSSARGSRGGWPRRRPWSARRRSRSEEHTSELQSRQYLVCRLLFEKKKQYTRLHTELHNTQVQ